MTEPRPVRADALSAGSMLVGAMVVGAVIGYGAGSLLGLAVPFGLAGLFLGLIAGFAAVYARFRRL
jgi:F0F1-type ATP synthase assembly protein I